MKELTKFLLEFVSHLSNLFGGKLFNKKTAFSMIEILLGLVVVSVAVVAFSPVITKKLSHSSMAVRQGIQTITDCKHISKDCKVCYKDQCVICNAPCAPDQYMIPSECKCHRCEDKAGVGCNRCANNEKQECEGCKAGYYLYSGDKKCYPCPAGFQCPEGSKCPIPCPESQWSEPGSSVCPLPCPPGKWCHTVDNASNVKQCGKERTQEPVPCGKYAPGGTPPFNCPAGRYQNLTGQTGCKCCPNGKLSPEGAGKCADTSCNIPCPEGHFCTNCAKIECPCGYKCPTGSGSPIPCPEGTIQSGSKKASCDNTSPGRWSYSGSCTDIPCPAGKYCPGNGKIYPCPCGHKCPQGSSAPTICPKGSFSGMGETTCDTSCGTTACPSEGTCANNTSSCLCGTYMNASTGNCIPCPVGQYQPNKNQASCIACPKGSYCSSTDQCKATKCPAGYYQDATSQTGCKPCPPGTYSSSAGSEKCTTCPAGSICPEEGMSAPQQCECGSQPDYPEGSTNGATSCRECGRGYYSTEGKQCLMCPAGTYSANGVNEVTIGDDEELSDEDIEARMGGYGSCECKSCPAGTCGPNAGAYTCYSCGTPQCEGAIQNAEGQTMCENCPNDGDYYSVNDEGTECINCSKNHNAHCEECNITECLECEDGFKVDPNDPHQCVPDVPDSSWCTNPRFLKIGNLCVMKYNPGDGNCTTKNGTAWATKITMPLPTAGLTCYKDGKLCGTNTNKKCSGAGEACYWKGQSTADGTGCSKLGSKREKYGYYAGGSRTVFNFKAAQTVCSNFEYKFTKDGVEYTISNWRLPTEAELTSWMDKNRMALQICGNHGTSDGVTMCSNSKFCYNSGTSKQFDGKNFSAHVCQPFKYWASNGKVYQREKATGGTQGTHWKIMSNGDAASGAAAASVRCVFDLNQ